ncbi:MAG TPA: hypothetical protein VKU85_18400 [bacterium]|nr:hypothetical protein [bacterium]
MLRNSRWTLLLLAMLSIALLPACGDDGDDSMGPGGSGAAILGTWNATSFNAGGQDFVPMGLTVQLTFTASTYTIGITGDSGNLLCDMSSSCMDGGPFTYTATTITFDAGTVDETTLNYTISGSTLTLTGDIDGTALTVTAVRA